MITTLKLSTPIDVFPFQRQYSSVFRAAYKRASDGLGQLAIREYIRDRNLSNTKKTNQAPLNSWLTQCAILDAISQYDAFDAQVKKGLRKTTNVVWGRKENMKARTDGKITRDEWKALRLRPMKIQGEKLQKSNRLFDFTRLKENILVFKPNATTRVEIPFVCSSPNQIKQIDYLCENIGNIPIQVQLQKGSVCLTFEQEKEPISNLLPHRKLGIDQNPNYIGVSIVDFIDGHEKLIKSFVYKWSNDARQNSNKRDHETKEIAHSIVRMAAHYKVSEIGLEKLSMGAKDAGKGADFNRLVNNEWNRTLFSQIVTKQATKYGIGIFVVNPAYSSTIGNVMHADQPDPAASAWEVARRVYHKHKKSLCLYPKLDKEYLENLNLWKKSDLDISQIHDWPGVHRAIKKAKLKYRVQISQLKSSVSRFSSIKSKILFYTDFACLY
jgi:IS605 OrfB family transposase